MPSKTTRTTVGAILGRALKLKGGEVSLEGARFILNLGICDEDKRRVHNLLARHEEGKITNEEAEELESYHEADYVLMVLKARARVALKEAGQEL